MKLSEFNKLSTSQKSDMVWEWGYFITKSNYGDHTVAIFYLAGFFVEMRISTVNNVTESILGLSKEQLYSEYPAVIKTSNFLVKKL